MTNKVVIVAAIAGAKGITLYHEDGRETNLSLEGWRTKEIMQKVAPVIARREKVEIDLDSYEVHASIEKKTGGLIRFVREKISFVRSWFKPAAEDEASKNVEAFTQTQSHAGHSYGVPTADPDQETVVAIIGDKKVPGVEALEKHMEHAVLSNNTEGVENFMKRIAAVIDKRGHSVQELLHFMRRGDLPIANDGSIIAYKVLRTDSRDGKNVIVDCHSGKVVQKVGSRVVMDEELVDPSRRTECSAGLHIARRGYLGSFHGDVIVMVKIAPEDVIAVPFNEPDKMRVAAYHIVGLIPASVHHLLRSNKPMTRDDEASKLLADVIAGNHVGVLEEVRITGPKGGGLVITPFVDGAPQPIVTGVNGTAKALDDLPEKVVSIKEIREIAKAAAPDAVEQKAEPPAHVEMRNGDLIVDGEKLETETAQERRNRVKREKRAAEKVAKAQSVSEAAMTGDMSAAISTPAPKTKPAPKRAVSIKEEAERRSLPEKHQKALTLHSEGKSNRQIEAELHICRKTLKKLFDKHDLKPNG